MSSSAKTVEKQFILSFATTQEILFRGLPIACPLRLRILSDQSQYRRSYPIIRLVSLKLPITRLPILRPRILRLRIKLSIITLLTLKLSITKLPILMLLLECRRSL